jgi:hypothetical protein
MLTKVSDLPSAVALSGDESIYVVQDGNSRKASVSLIGKDSPLSHDHIVQKKMMETFLGFNNGTTNTEIFTGAERTTQGLAYANFGGSDKVYLLQPVAAAGSFNSTVVSAGSFATGTIYEIVSAGTTNFTLIGAANNDVGTRFTATGAGTGTGSAAVVESQRIVEYSLADDGSVVSNNVFTGVLNLGHQGLSAFVDDGDLYLYTQYITQPTFRGNNGGKGFAKILWDGASTSSVTNYQLFGYDGSGHKFEKFRGATPSVSTDGKYIVMSANNSPFGSIGDDQVWFFVYDRAQVEALPNPLDAIPLHYGLLKFPEKTQRTIYTQGVASDGKFIYVFRGFTTPRFNHVIQKFDFYGNLISEVSVDDARAQYGVSGLLDNPTLGFPTSFEPEGLAIKGDELLLLVMDYWRTGSDVVSYKGKRYAAIKNNSNTAPDSFTGELSWTETKKSPGAAEWSPFTSYSSGTNFTQRNKLIYSIKPETGVLGEEPINSALTCRVSGASIVSRENAVDVSVTAGQTLKFAYYSELTEGYTSLLDIGAGNGNITRFYDARPQSTDSRTSNINSVQETTPSVRSIIEIRGDRTLTNGAGINLYGTVDSVNSNRARLYAGGTFSGSDVFVDLVNQTPPVLRPNGSLDGQINLGGASNRWGTVFAATGTIDTSDAREKQDVTDITEAEKRVAVAIKGMLKSFRFRDAVALKGDDARIHFGVIAQDIKAAFEAEGLDPTRYALFCWDEWGEQPEIEGEQSYAPSGDRYGIRYSELFSFIISSL